MSSYDDNIQGGVEDAQYESAGGAREESWREEQNRGYRDRPERKSVAGAAILSMLPGVGQIYAGYYQRGFTHIVVFASLILLLSEGDLRELAPFFGIFLAFYWIYNIIDASRCVQIANRLSRGANVADAGDQLPLPGQFGGATMGFILIGFGTLILMVTRFDFDMRWLEEWWPVGLILFGLNLVYRARR